MSLSPAPPRPAAILIAGKDPLVSIGGHGSYVRVHARALGRVGFEPHIFSVFPRGEVRPTDFGLLHRAASPVWPDRPWLLPAHAGPIARRLEGFVRDRGLPRVLLHSFGLWGGIGVAVARRLARRGIEATAIVSSYGPYEFEARLYAAGLDPAHGRLPRQRARAIRLWARLAVEPRERRGYVGSRLVLVNYERMRELLRERYGLGPTCRTLPYTAESAFLRDVAIPGTPRPGPPPGEAGEDPLVVAVSRHDGRKGVDVLLRALARLRAAGVRFRACLVGGGPLLDADRRLAARLGLGEAVAIEGYVPDPYPYLRRADVFALPSLGESSGSLSLIEALQQGLPAVASACDGIPEDVVDGRSALLVPPGDVAALAAALQRLLADPDLRATLARGAVEVFRQRFSPALLVDALRDLYADLGFVPRPPTGTL